MRLRPDGGSFPPSAQYGKQEIHQVFLCFPNFRLRKNPSPPALAELCGVALIIPAWRGKVNSSFGGMAGLQNRVFGRMGAGGMSCRIFSKDAHRERAIREQPESAQTYDTGMDPPGPGFNGETYLQAADGSRFFFGALRQASFAHRAALWIEVEHGTERIPCRN